MYVPALVFIHFARCPTKHAYFHAVQYFLQFGYTVKSLKMHDTVTSIIKKSRKENPQKPTQLSSRSHPRHLVGKRTAQKTPS